MTHRESAGPRRCSVVHNGNLCGTIEAMQVQDIKVRPPWHSVNLHDVIVRRTGLTGETFPLSLMALADNAC